MTKVHCEYKECLYCESDYVCSMDTVTLSEAGSYYNDCSCEAYLDIRLTEEYTQKYYKRVPNIVTKNPEKHLAQGKKIEKYGLIFYTEQDTRHNENYDLTEEMTGLLVPNIALKEEKWLTRVRETIKNTVPVKELPDYKEIEEE